MKETYTREELIRLCEKAIVPCDKWSNRDSSDAIRQIGNTWALLKAGCPFKVLTEGNLKTDDRTIWVECTFTNFMGYECGVDDNAKETNYIPTEKRLKEKKGSDWY